MKIWIIYDSKFGNNKQVADAIKNAFLSRGDEHLVKMAYANHVEPSLVLADKPDIVIFGGPLRASEISLTLRTWVSRFDHTAKWRKKGASIQVIALWYTHVEDLDIRDKLALKIAKLGLRALWLPVILDVKVHGFKGPLEPTYADKVTEFVAMVLNALE